MTFSLFVEGSTLTTNVLYANKLHWSARARLARLVHTQVVALVRERYAEPPQFSTPVVITATCYAVRPPDASGVAAAYKLIEDGLVRAGVLPDDNYQHVAEVRLRSRKADAKHPPGVKVVVELSEEGE